MPRHLKAFRTSLQRGGHLLLTTSLASNQQLEQKLPPLLAVAPFYPLCHFGDPIIMGETQYGNHGFHTAADPQLAGITQQVSTYLDKQIYGGN